MQKSHELPKVEFHAIRMPMDTELRRQIQEELEGKEDSHVQIQFMTTYRTELEEFLREMTIAFER